MTKLLKLFAYAKSPVKTFAVLHPAKMLKIGAYFLVGRMLFSWGKKEGREETAEKRSAGRSRAAGRKPVARSRGTPVSHSEPPAGAEASAADVTPEPQPAVVEEKT